MDYVIDSTTECLHSTAGIAIAGKIFEKIGLGYQSAHTQIKHPEVLKSIAGLFVQGRTHFEEIRLFKDDVFFKESLGLTYVPAAETVRLYMEQMVSQESSVKKTIELSNISLLKSAALTSISVNYREYLPIDVDTSPLDNSKSNKEGVSLTYKQYVGFHPIFSYIGTEGYMLNCELREGSQHCQKGTPEYLKQTIALANQLQRKESLLFRLDSGNDSQDTLKVLSESGHFFILKRNLRKELPEYWLDIAKAEGDVTIHNEQKTVYTGIHTGKTPVHDQGFVALDVVFQVTERRYDRNGTKLLFPEIEVETFWTNVYENPLDVIELYHAHGTSEQFHSELKTDMNVERLPSGKFVVNAMLLQIAMVSFNTLRFIGQKALTLEGDLPYKSNVRRKRLRKVIDDLIRVACKIVRHSRKTIIKLRESDPWLSCFKKIYLICCNL